MNITLTYDEAIEGIRRLWSLPLETEITILEPDALPDVISAEIEKLINDVEDNLSVNNKIGAIKVYRDASVIVPNGPLYLGNTKRCVGLKESKDIVEDWPNAKRAIIKHRSVVTINYGLPLSNRYVPYV